MIAAIVTAILTLVQELFPVIMKAVGARQEDHAQILADAQAAVDRFNAALANLSTTLAKDDAQADAELAAKFPGGK